MKKKTVVICDDQRRFIDSFQAEHGAYYNIIPVFDTRNLFSVLDDLVELPDILLLDLYHPRDNQPDFERRRIQAEDSLTALDAQIERTKNAVNLAWEPFGIEMLKILRQRYDPNELPIAIFTQKGLLLLEDQQLQDVEISQAHWLLKNKLSTRTEEVSIDRIISYWKDSTGFPEGLNKRVFIIHGHDYANRDRLKKLLKELFGLDPIVLAELPGRGRTIIQKLEEEASTASFAFALLTPDDMVASTTSEQAQARPNVMIEIGWFYGRLGRSRVCLLQQENTSIPSDLHGVDHISFHKDVGEVTVSIEAELAAAGLIEKRP